MDARPKNAMTTSKQEKFMVLSFSGFADRGDQAPGKARPSARVLAAPFVLAELENPAFAGAILLMEI
jgi:hypothetical protein